MEKRPSDKTSPVPIAIDTRRKIPQINRRLLHPRGPDTPTFIFPATATGITRATRIRDPYDRLLAGRTLESVYGIKTGLQLQWEQLLVTLQVRAFQRGRQALPLVE
jgi:hypothetical protein